jgi:hypothetical protein
MLLFISRLVSVLLFTQWAAHAANISMTIKFTEASLNKKWFGSSDEVFGLSWYTCTQTPDYDSSASGTPSCPVGQTAFTKSWAVRTSNKVAPNTWLKTITVPSPYTGPVTITLYAPTIFGLDSSSNTLFFNSSVTDCLTLADQEMSSE